MALLAAAAALAVPKPAPVAALKAYYPRKPVRVTRICRVERQALVTARVGRRKVLAVLDRPRPHRWRVVWLDGRLVKGVPRSRHQDVLRLRTRCLAP